MKRIIKQRVGLALCALALSGCQIVPEPPSEGSAANPPEMEQTDAMEAADMKQPAHYPSAIKNGHYPLNEARGLVAGATSEANLRRLEQETYRRMQQTFATTDYALGEGTVLDRDTLSSWLRPQSDDNPDGLNAKNAATNNPDRFEPRYLNTILEYDLYRNDEDHVGERGGLVFSLAMNAEDTFTGDNGEQKTIAIDADTALEQGKALAQEVLKRVRSERDYDNLPIQFFIFYNQAGNGPAGGVVLSDALAAKGNDTVDDWHDAKRQAVVFGVDETPNEEDATIFARYREEMEAFFPELIGVAGVGYYQDGGLEAVELELTTPFAGYSELTALLQEATTTADGAFNRQLEMQITVIGPAGHAVAHATRAAGGAPFTTTIE